MVCSMPTNEKEIICNLLDQLFIIEETIKALDTGGENKAREYLAMKKQQIERKLYQQPSLVSQQ